MPEDDATTTIFAKPTKPAWREPKDSNADASPSRPPISPLTPAATLAQLASATTTVHPPLPSQLDGAASDQVDERRDSATSEAVKITPPERADVSVSEDPQEAQVIPPPKPETFEDDGNTDVVALRAALAILQHQKDKSVRDIRTLQQLKQGLREDPAGFAEALTSGKMREDRLPSDPLHATFSGEEDLEDDEETIEDAPADAQAETGTSPSYPPIPGKQNVIRCPPVNWAKYHIIGESLDKMHEEQRKRPTQGQPSAGVVTSGTNPFHTPSSAPPGPMAPEHHIFKPYDPFTDTLSNASPRRDGVQTRRSSKIP